MAGRRYPVVLFLITLDDFLHLSPTFTFHVTSSSSFKYCSLVILKSTKNWFCTIFNHCIKIFKKGNIPKLAGIHCCFSDAACCVLPSAPPAILSIKSPAYLMLWNSSTTNPTV